jgi:hypothetical protein
VHLMWSCSLEYYAECHSSMCPGAMLQDKPTTEILCLMDWNITPKFLLSSLICPRARQLERLSDMTCRVLTIDILWVYMTAMSLERQWLASLGCWTCFWLRTCPQSMKGAYVKSIVVPHHLWHSSTLLLILPRLSS